MSALAAPVAIYLITGFLGAGKTTFLKNRLAGSALRTGVLVNDFGKINFDGLQIRREGLEMIELSNGSIFCSCLKNDFIDGLVQLIQLGLDEILIESSGLADPSDLGQILDIVHLRSAGAAFRFCGTICLVDGLFFPKVLPKMLSVERQVRHSHLILINKCDLINAEQLAHIRSTIAALNPQARLIDTTYGWVEWPPAIDLFAIPDEETTNRIETRNKNLVLHLLHEPEATAFRTFLDALGGHFFRVKGIVHLDGRLQKIDLVNQQIQIGPAPEPTDPAGVDQLICLTSQGLASISHLARMADQYLPGIFSLEM